MEPTPSGIKSQLFFAIPMHTGDALYSNATDCLKHCKCTRHARGFIPV